MVTIKKDNFIVVKTLVYKLLYRVIYLHIHHYHLGQSSCHILAASTHSWKR